MTTARSKLIISNKNNPQKSETSFRQLENWANGGAWTNVNFAANFLNFGSTFRTAQYFLDPFGIVHLRGLLQYNGTLTSGTTTTMFTLPITYAPRETEVFSCILQLAATAVGSRVDVEGLNTGTPGAVMIVNQTGANSHASPYISISGITFAAGV